MYYLLEFDSFDVFESDKINSAKLIVENLCKFLKEKPICIKHKEVLNLYCQTDKQLVCVECIYKLNPDHKNHSVKGI